MKGLGRAIGRFVVKNRNVILFAVSTVAIVGTAVCAGADTKKALEAVKEAEKREGELHLKEGYL